MDLEGRMFRILINICSKNQFFVFSFPRFIPWKQWPKSIKTDQHNPVTADSLLSNVTSGAPKLALPVLYPAGLTIYYFSYKNQSSWIFILGRPSFAYPKMEKSSSASPMQFCLQAFHMYIILSHSSLSLFCPYDK